MGCNCNNGTVPISVRKQERRRMKDRIEDVKRLWRESGSQSSGNGNVTVTKDELGFK